MRPDKQIKSYEKHKKIQMCLGRIQMCSGPTQVCLSPTQMFFGRTQMIPPDLYPSEPDALHPPGAGDGAGQTTEMAIGAGQTTFGPSGSDGHSSYLDGFWSKTYPAPMAIPHILLLSGNQQKKTVAGYVGSSSGMTPRAEVIENFGGTEESRKNMKIEKKLDWPHLN